MNGFDAWDGTLLVVAAYVAVTSLVRLMANHRQRLTAELRIQIDAEQRRMKDNAAAKNRPQSGKGQSGKGQSGKGQSRPGSAA